MGIDSARLDEVEEPFSAGLSPATDTLIDMADIRPGMRARVAALDWIRGARLTQRAHVAEVHWRASGMLGFYSITSSARASSEGGTVRFSILAVSALMTSSNVLDCKTGRSVGLAPLRV